MKVRERDGRTDGRFFADTKREREGRLEGRSEVFFCTSAAVMEGGESEVGTGLLRSTLLFPLFSIFLAVA